jgi:hypothetical protein
VFEPRSLILAFFVLFLHHTLSSPLPFVLALFSTPSHLMAAHVPATVAAPQALVVRDNNVHDPGIVDAYRYQAELLSRLTGACMSLHLMSDYI